MKIYSFNEDQLRSMLLGAIEMYKEWHYQHGKTEVESGELAVKEVIDGIESEKYLVEENLLPAKRLKLLLECRVPHT